MEARAYGGALGAAYDHPLLEPATASLLAGDERAAIDILPDLHIRTTFDGTEGDSVVVTRSVQWVDREDDVVEPPVTGPLDPPDLPRVDGLVLDAMARAGAGEVEELDITVTLDRLSWNPIVSVEHELFVAMLDGSIATRRDALQVRHEAIDAKTAAGSAALEPVLAELDSLGFEILSANGVTGSATLRLTSDMIADLMAVDGIARIDQVVPDDPAAGYPNGTEVTGTTIDGVERDNLLQLSQSYSAGYYGDSDGYIGLTEGDSPGAGDHVRREHLGFDDASAADRFENCADIVGTACGTNPDPDPGNLHATVVASVLMGDLTLGQDTGIATPGRARRSGVARRAWGLGTPSTDVGDVAAAMTLASRDIHVVNYSGGWTGYNCDGATGRSQAFNGMYEDGVATFAAAGNEGHSTGGCTVRDPGFALGVFTVGAYQVDSADDEVIYPSQSRGGGEYCAGGTCADDGRTLIDVQGPTQHTLAYSEDSTDTDQYNQTLCCTSGATPTVAGGAALFRDWYLDVAGTLIDSPGILYADMLLMGDRIDETGTYMDSGFDQLTGAGKLRLRRWDNLDLPARAEEGTVCVDDGSAVYIELDDDPLSADVDMIKAVIWWYDHRHDSGTVIHDKVNLSLQVYNSGLGAWGLVESSTTDDNKQRVYLDNPSNSKYRLKITGADVSSNYEGCGLASTRVYYAYLFEDQDRDTGTVLDDHIRPEQ